MNFFVKLFVKFLCLFQFKTNPNSDSSNMWATSFQIHNYFRLQILGLEPILLKKFQSNQSTLK